MKLRDYQTDCLDACWQELRKDAARTLSVLPTGTGKTVLFATIADRWHKSGYGRVLILAHRYELIDQAAQKYERIAGYRPEIEMASSWVSHGMWSANHVVVGSVATMRGKRLERFPRDFFSLIIVDEAHHCTAPSYRKIFDHFQDARILGVTATPDRSDKSPLGKIFRTVAYSMEILGAINSGWLVPIRQKFIRCNTLNLDDVGNNWKGDDLDLTELDKVMRQDDAVHRIAKPTFEKAGNRQTLVFATSVAHAKALSDVLNSYREGASEYIASYRIREDGGQDTFSEDLRAKEIALFKEGRRQFLCSCGVFLEGFDAPPTALISMARPTKSRALYAQAIGRGTRPLDGLVDSHELAADRIAAILTSQKPDCLVLDFPGNSSKHKLIYADDILFPDADAEVRERARSRMERSDKGEKVEKAIEEAQEEIRVERITRIDQLRRKLARRLQAEFFEKDVDPFGDTSGRYIVPTPPDMHHTPPSEKQVKYVLFLGRRLGRKYSFETIKAMPRKQVQGMIATLQRQMERQGVSA